ncbi:unnamed protein product [Ilex paraguariensis]|uniref:Cell cycle checkpoint protein RAD17 n=1 Tax=Ilex paraguariensis TaxID=185542 RepID=A0ABC8U5W0_9AQUA
MGKRNAIVISSSDDDDKHFSMSSNLSYSKSISKSRRSSVPRVNPKRAKKAPLSNPGYRLCEESNGFDEIRRFCEDFDEGFTVFKVSAGHGQSNKDLWVDKYKPRSLEELAVNKKKVEEVKSWFEERLRTAREEFCNHVLLITGQAGVGKSATINVIASHLGATLCEWNTPTPTMWQEHLHNSNSGVRYMSKLDEFESFVDRIRKYGIVSSSCTGGSKKSTILLIEDLPVINGKVAYERLRRCLQLLVQSISIPTGILITDYGKDDSADYSTRCWEELQLSLLGAGVCKVAFNPITVNSIKKTLSKICSEEQCAVTAEQIDLIAKASGGDIRHSIMSVQYFCLKPHRMLPLIVSNNTLTSSKERSDEINSFNDGFSLPFGRDETLSLFHALGKFLHNKRETDVSIASVDKDAVRLRERYVRLPLKMDAPEKVLCQAHGQARPIADFLHENVLDFLSEEAIDDAWVMASYLSDADFLLTSLSGMQTRNFEAENVVQSAAASVSVRGVLFGNSHPLSSRWHAIRRPKLWQIEQSLRHNKDDMVSQRCVAYNGLNFSDLSVIAMEWKPILKWLGYRASENCEANRALMESNVVVDEDFGSITLDDTNIETSDDEIEDW